ncbi:MAG: amidase [Chitinophagaceae bacterium]
MKQLFCLAIICCYVQVQAQDTLKQAVKLSAHLIDIHFTEKEIDTLLEGVKENLENFKLQHKLTLENHIPSTLWQNPVLPNMQFNKQQLPATWIIPNTVQLPTNKNDLAFYSILELASLIKNKKISSVELTNFFIDRLKKFNDSLLCTITITEDTALMQAKQADMLLAKGIYRSILQGIPYGLKDLFAVKGYKTTWGAAPFQNQIIHEDAFVYQQLRNTGAVLIAKFTLGALAQGDKWYGGQTKNPWNLRFGSSGSSAGSASATVAGLAPFAIGTETWGSIVSPSATCGATGLRPTFGSISRSGAMTLSWSLDKVGPICRSAEDAAIVYHYIHGTDGKDISAVNMPFNYPVKKSVKDMKIGYAKNYFDRIKDTTRNEWKVLQEFRKMGAELIPIAFPDSGVYSFNIMDVVISAECAAAFDDFTRNNIDDQLTAQGKYDWPNTFRVARLIPAVEYINANRHRYLLMQKVNDVLTQFDVIICPTRGSGNQTAITNLTGHPVVVVPTGFDSRNQLPTSITFIGNLYDEATILTAANAYQLATKWHLMHPAMFQ